MKKRFVGLSLVLLLTFASSITAGAEELKGEAGWQVTFNGKRMESNFTSAGMADGINAMQPGDSVELTITLKNDFDGQADWYMKNEVLEALEDAGDAEGGAYDYLLTYTDVTNTVTTLYSSEKFGGEGRYNGVGLHGATTTLDDFFYLDRMGEGDTGVVKLMVALDGETLVNNYQNTYAKLQLDFATELISTPSGRPNRTREDTVIVREVPSSTARRTGVVQTGDESPVMLYLALMLAAGLGLLVIVIFRLRREQEEAAPETMTGRRRRK